MGPIARINIEEGFVTIYGIDISVAVAKYGLLVNLCIQHSSTIQLSYSKS